MKIGTKCQTSVRSKRNWRNRRSWRIIRSKSKASLKSKSHILANWPQRRPSRSATKGPTRCKRASNRKGSCVHKASLPTQSNFSSPMRKKKRKSRKNQRRSSETAPRPLLSRHLHRPSSPSCWRRLFFTRNSDSRLSHLSSCPSHHSSFLYILGRCHSKCSCQSRRPP